MKKIYFLFLLFLLLNQKIFSQHYYPLLDSAINHWRFTENYLPVRVAQPTAIFNCDYNSYPPKELSTIGDTILNAKHYKILIATAFSSDCIFGYLREDTAARKVYFQDVLNAPEILVYDFSMQVGDSMYIHFYNQSSGYFTDGNYTLDSIKNVTMSAGTRRAFYLNHKINLNPSDPHTLIWYESVGNPFFTVYPYSLNWYSSGWFSVCEEFPHDFFQFLTCYDHASKVYYDTCGYWVAHNNNCVYFADSCDYGNTCTYVKELSDDVTFSIFPNPAASKLTVDYSLLKSDEFELLFHEASTYRVIKKLTLGILSKGKNAIDTDVSNLPKGFYILEFRSKKESKFEKLVVMR